MSTSPGGNTNTIARNSVWYGIEMVFELLVALATSIPMARVLGPAKLSDFTLVMWVLNVSGMLGSLGAPNAARKYMAEFLNRGQSGMARAVFDHALRLQVRSAVIVLVAGGAALYALIEPANLLMTFLLLLSMFPNMLELVPANANLAAENLRANVAATLIGQTIYAISVWLSLWRGWDLLGVAAGILVFRMVQMLVRMVPAIRWMRTLPKATLDAETLKRVHSFSIGSTAVTLLSLWVWNRSDMLFLKWLSTDLRQLTFYSLALNLSDKAMRLPRIFAIAAGTSILAQFGRDPVRLNQMLRATSSYLLLIGMPVLWGMSGLAGALIRTMYGPKYLEAIPILMLGAFLSAPALLWLPAQNYLEARERQRILIVWTVVAVVVNVVLDILLIPRLGALGAVIGTGSAQVVAIAGVWYRIGKEFGVGLEWGRLTRLTLSALCCWVAAFLATWNLPQWAGLITGAVSGAVAFVIAARLFRAVTEDDAKRLQGLANRLPGRYRGVMDRLLAWMVPAGAAV